MDSLDLSESAMGPPESPSEAALRAAYAPAAAALTAALAAAGVTADPDPVGRPFDPASHEAAAAAPSDAYPDGAVAAVLRRGYRGPAGRLLRPALVSVSTGPGPAAPGPGRDTAGPDVGPAGGGASGPLPVEPE